MPDETHPAGRGRKKDRAAQPAVGIFWLINGKPLIDSTPLSEAEPYGEHLTHPRGHAAVWERYQRNGVVSPEMEYEEAPRGRVMYNTKSQRFTLLADRCILKDNGIASQIMSEMKLPNEKTDKGKDSHYQCSACLRGNAC